MADSVTAQLAPGLAILDEEMARTKGIAAQSALQADLPAIQNAVKSGDYMTGFSLLAKHNPKILESPLAKMFGGNPEFEGSVKRATTPNEIVDTGTGTLLVNPFSGEKNNLGLGSPKAMAKKAQDAATSEARAFRQQESNNNFARTSLTTLQNSEQFKNLQMIKAKKAQMENALTNPSAYGDIATVFSFMKTLDPASVVRESEYATAAEAGSLLQRGLNILSKAEKGQPLQPSQRAELLKIANHIQASQEQNYADVASRFQQQAVRRGVDPTELDPAYDTTKKVMDLRSIPTNPSAQSASSDRGEVITASQIERKDPKSGRIVIYDSVTKKPLRFKD